MDIIKIEQRGKRKETVISAVKESLNELKRDGCPVYPWLMPLTFEKIFGGFLLINPQTPTGNEIPADVLTTAYSMWSKARLEAEDRGIDETDAAEALLHVVHVVADRLARGKNKPIHDLRSYMSTGYLNRLKLIAKKIGVVPPNLNPQEPSDDGAFSAALEAAMLCEEISRGLSAKECEAVYFRFKLGCRYAETAALMGISSSAARQIVRRALKKMLDAYTRNNRTRD